MSGFRSKLCKAIPMQCYRKCINENCIIAGGCIHKSQLLNGLSKEDVKTFNNMYKNSLRNFWIIEKSHRRRREENLKMTETYSELISHSDEIKE